MLANRARQIWHEIWRKPSTLQSSHYLLSRGVTDNEKSIEGISRRSSEQTSERSNERSRRRRAAKQVKFQRLKAMPSMVEHLERFWFRKQWTAESALNTFGVEALENTA